MDSKKPIYKSIPFWIMVLFLLYSALGFFAVPYFARDEIKSLSISQLNSSIEVKEISFNPYLFSTTLTGVNLSDNDSTLWFSADSIEVDLNLFTSLISNISLSTITINKPFYKVITTKSKGVSSVKYPQINPSQKQQDTELVLDIDSIIINNGSIDYNDQTGSKQLQLNIKELVFKHQNFTTKDQNTLFDLKFLTDKNESTKINGIFNYAKLNLDAKWTLNNWRTETLFSFIADKENNFLGFKNKSGAINANGKVAYSSNESEYPTLKINELNLLKFATLGDVKDQPKIIIDTVNLYNADINLDTQKLSIETISTNKAQVSLAFDDEYNLKFRQTTESKKPDNLEDKKWSYSIQEIIVTDSNLLLNKQIYNTIKLPKISIKNFSNTDNKIATILIDIIADKTAKIGVNADLQLHPFEVNANIIAKEFDISNWNNWLPPKINLKSQSGLLSLNQEIMLDNSVLEAKGWIKLNNIELLDNNNQQFLSVNQLEVLENHLNSKVKTITLNKIKIDKANGMLSVSPDKKLNLNELVNKSENNPQSTKPTDWIIEVKQVDIIDSSTDFKDSSITPQYQTNLSKLSGSIKGLSSANLSKADINLNGVIDTYASISIAGQINPLADKAFTDLSIDVKNLNLQNFDTYSSQYLGFPITRGQADFVLKYKLNQSLLNGVNNLKFKQLKFGEKNQSKEAISLPLKLAVSLLTDGNGIMKINLPVKGNLEDPEFSYGSIVFKAFFKLITGIVASPFKLLGKLIPGAADLDLSGIHFKTGTSELDLGEEEKLNAMQKIMQQRPEIILELTAVLNTIGDSKALQKTSLQQELKIKTLSGLSETKVINILKRYYTRMFSKEKWQQLTVKATTDGIVNLIQVKNNAWNELLTLQNVDEELSSLVKYRALSIKQLLIEKHAISADRIFLKSHQKSDTLHPQVKFGVSN